MMKVNAGDMDNNATLTSDQLEHRLEGSDAQTCVVASHSPSVHVYYALRSQIERSSATWLQEFVSLGGLDSLLDSMCQMTGKTFTSFSDAILQIDCISCIRAILNTPLGIDHLLHSSDAAHKLIKGLTISNTLPKKQILEMCAAICAHSALGYNKILDGLEHLKRKTNQYHRFSIIVNELKSAETVPHKTAVMTLVNTIVNCNLDLGLRCRLRNQMIGLTLLDVISFLQREETDDDLHIQIQTFHERKHQDEEILQGRAEGDLSSPTDIADVLQSRVFGTSRMVSLVNILQDLLAIEVLEKREKERLWSMVEQQVHHLVHASRHRPITLSGLTPRQVDDLLYSEMQRTESLVAQATDSIQSASDNNHSMYDNMDVDKRSKDTTATKHRMKVSEPDLLGDLNDLNIPASPTANTGVTKPELTKKAEFPTLNLRPPRPSLPQFPVTVTSYAHVYTRRGSLEGKSYRGSKHRLLCMSSVPFPGRLMRNFKWIKVSDSVVDSNKGCLWEPREVIPRFEPDYCRLEQLFAETHVPDMNDEVPLLSATTRLRINLFLNRLEVEPDELVRNLINTDAQGLTLPLLKYLHDILPCHEEMVMLKQYNGSLLDIGMAEQFLMHLMDIPDYRTLLLGHLTRLEFVANVSRLQSALRAMVLACRFLLGSREVVDLMQLIIRVGNFLNHGQFNGNASGVKLSSLKRLREVSSLEPNHTLLHQIVTVIEESDDGMFKLLTEISKLEEAARFSLEDIKNDVTAMNAQLKQFVLQLTFAHPHITDIFHHFLEEVKKDFTEMQHSISELRDLSKEVALYVCEAPTSFNLQTCLNDLIAFFKDIRLARHENTLFKEQRTQARRRSDHFKAKLKSKRLALEFGKEARASSSMLEERRRVMERILGELHRGNFRPVVAAELHTPEHEEEASLGIDNFPTPVTTPIQQTIQLAAVTTSRVTTARKAQTSPQKPKRPFMELSRISLAGTPMINRPSSEIFEDDLFHFTPKHSTKGKVMTSSANDLLDEPQPPPTLPPKLHHPQVKYLQQAEAGQPTSATPQSSHVGQHHRSRSDLTDSIGPANKWLKYEEMKQLERKNNKAEGAPIALPESSFTLATLNLEDGWSRHKTSEPVMRLNAGPIVYVPQQGGGAGMKHRRGEKKTAFGTFFSKISRAVLRPRNSANVERNILRPSQTQSKGKRKGHTDLVIENKENVATGSEELAHAMKRMTKARGHEIVT